MHILSGKYKGLKLIGYENEGTRPTKSIVKESMVAMIQGYLEDAVILDLFAGSGAVGLEMLSYGGKELYLNDLNSYDILKQNTERISLPVRLAKMDAIKYVKALGENNVKFDVIFIDPPYFYKQHHKIINIIKEYQMLTSEGLLIYELDLKEELEDPGLELIKEKKYGKTKVLIYKNLDL